MTAFWWAICASLAWGLTPLIEKTGLSKTAPMAGLFYRSLGVMLGLVVLGLFMVKPQELRAVDPRSALMLAGGGLLASFIGQICFYNALKVGEMSRVVPISASYPFIAFILGILVLGESMSLYKGIGVLLIVAGVWLLKIG